MSTSSQERTRSRNAIVIAAIAANVAIAVTKFVAAAFSHSSAMFSEGLHSMVDTGDGLLVMLGLHLSRKAATSSHPYGRGAEVYFWSMVVAMSIFGVGGGLSIYQGIEHLRVPREPGSLGWSYAVLAAAFVFEGMSWIVSMRGFRRARGPKGLWQAIRSSKDPSTFVIVLEDSAALVGIALAAAGITLAHLLEAPSYDAIASILIGGLLVGVGIVLGRETWSLLVGESAESELVREIQVLASARPPLMNADSPRTMYIGPDVLHVDLDIRVDRSASVGELVDTVRSLEAEVRDKHPAIRRLSLRFID